MFLQLDCSTAGAAAAGMRIRLQGPGHATSLLAELNSCRQSRQYCDVFLQVGNRTFAAHRAVLACAGTYFRNLFARSPATSTTAFSLEFISPGNFEKVLTFVYSGEIFTDLIDVGVLYELAERLGISELVRACHATFPDLQTSVCANGKASSPGNLLDSKMVAAGSTGVAVSAASLSASSLCSSAASCSSLSSSAGPSAAPTPSSAPSPLFQARTVRAGREARVGALSLDLKAEDIQSHIGYGQMAADHQLPGHHLVNSSPSGESGIVPLGPVLPLKTEQGLEEEAGGSCEEGGRNGGTVSESSLPQSSDPAMSDSCAFHNSSAQVGAEACARTSSSPSEPAGGLQVGEGDGSVLFGEVEEGENETEAMQGNSAMEGTEEQWRQLADEIIELSDDENFMEEGDEEDDEDDLVCVENGEGGTSSHEVMFLSAVQ